MSDSFNPYHKWLGIPPEDQPPNHYRLLGITLFENNREVIEAAANRQMAYMQEISAGDEHIDLAQKILGELSRARICLLNQEKKKAYDEKLRASFDSLAPVPETQGPKPAASSAPLMPPQIGKSTPNRPATGGGSPAAAKPKPQQSGTPADSRTKTKKRKSVLWIALPTVVILALAIYLTLQFIDNQAAERKEEARKSEIDKLDALRRANTAEREAEAANFKLQRKRTEEKEEEEAEAERQAEKIKQAAANLTAKREIEQAKRESQNNVLKQLQDDHGITTAEVKSTILEWPELKAFKRLKSSETKTPDAADKLSDSHKNAGEARKDLLGKESDITRLIKQLNTNQIESEKEFKLATVPPLPEWVEQQLGKKKLETLGWQSLEPTEGQKHSQWLSPLHVKLETEIAQFNNIPENQWPQTLAWIFNTHNELESFEATDDEQLLLRSINGEIGRILVPDSIQEAKEGLVKKYQAVIADSEFSLNADNRWEHTLANNSSEKKSIARKENRTKDRHELIYSTTSCKK